MAWTNLILLAHVALAFALVTGLVGPRRLPTSRGSKDPGTAFALSQAAAPFERMVVLSGPAIIGAGLITAGAKTTHTWD